MKNYKYCLEIAEKNIKDGMISYKFKQIFLGYEENLKKFK